MPTVYALMQHRTRESYEELLTAVVQECERLRVTLDPAEVMTDFEAAAIQAVRNVLHEDPKPRCCFFHLCQSTWRKVQSLGLVTTYRNNSEFRLFVGKLDGLAFLPVEDVPDGMRLLKDTYPDEAVKLLEYFDATYITGGYRSLSRADSTLSLRCSSPPFPPDLWNVHDTTISGGGHSTNNNCEAWNRRIGSLVGHKHPNAWKLLETLRHEDVDVQGKIARSGAGAPPAKRVRTATV